MFKLLKIQYEKYFRKGYDEGFQRGECAGYIRGYKEGMKKNIAASRRALSLSKELKSLWKFT